MIGTGIVAAADASASTSPPGSTEPATSDGATTTSTSTVAPTTTLDPVAAEEAAVAQAAVEARTARMDALVNPDDPDVIAALDTHYVADGAAREEIDERIASMHEEGLTVVANADVPDTLTVEDVVLVDGPPSTSAEVTACVVESGTYYGEVPETSLVVVGDDYRAFRAVYAMVNDDGTWKVDTATFVDEWPGETTCPPPPPTTTAAPTTLDPIAAEEALVAQRVQEIQAVRLNAYINLDAPGNAEALDASYTADGEARSRSSRVTCRRYETRVGESVSNPEVATSLHVSKRRARRRSARDTADVTVCIVDSGDRL